MNIDDINLTELYINGICHNFVTLTCSVWDMAYAHIECYGQMGLPNGSIVGRFKFRFYNKNHTLDFESLEFSSYELCFAAAQQLVNERYVRGRLSRNQLSLNM